MPSYPRDSASYEGTIRSDQGSRASTIHAENESQASLTQDDAVEQRAAIEQEVLAQQARGSEPNNELRQLEQELKELIDAFDRAPSPEAKAQVLRRIWEVQDKINTLSPPDRRTENQLASRPQNSEPQLLNQPRGGEPSRGASGVGAAKAGNSASRKLKKSDDQRMDAELERIKEELATDKRCVEALHKIYPEILCAARQEAEIIQRVRKEALARLDRTSEKNQARLDSLTALFNHASVNRHGQSINKDFLACVIACRKDCTEFAGDIETKKQQVDALQPAQVRLRELRLSSNHLAGQARGIAVH
jgi:hypothetical protein